MPQQSFEYSEAMRELHRLIEGPGKTSRTPTVKEITIRAGSTVYAYLRGELDTPLSAFRAIYNICKDRGCPPVSALRALVSECDDMLILTDPRDAARPDGRVDDNLRRITVANGRLNAAVERALSDNETIDEHEKAAIREAIAEQKAELDGLTAELAKGKSIEYTQHGAFVKRIPA